MLPDKSGSSEGRKMPDGGQVAAALLARMRSAAVVAVIAAILAGCGAANGKSPLGVKGDQPSGCHQISPSGKGLESSFLCAKVSRVISTGALEPFFRRLCVQKPIGLVSVQPDNIFANIGHDGITELVGFTDGLIVEHHLDGRQPYLSLGCGDGTPSHDLTSAQVAAGPGVLAVDNVLPKTLLASLLDQRLTASDVPGYSPGITTTLPHADAPPKHEIGGVQVSLTGPFGEHVQASFDVYDGGEPAQEAYYTESSNTFAAAPIGTGYAIDLNPGRLGNCELALPPYGTNCAVVSHEVLIEFSDPTRRMDLMPAQMLMQDLLTHLLAVDLHPHLSPEPSPISSPPTAVSVGAPQPPTTASTTPGPRELQTGCPPLGSQPLTALMAGANAVLKAWQAGDFASVDPCQQAGPGLGPSFVGQPFQRGASSTCRDTGLKFSSTGAEEYDCIVMRADGSFLLRIAYGALGSRPYIADISFTNGQPLEHG